jgi:hypothetical protein
MRNFAFLVVLILFIVSGCSGINYSIIENSQNSSQFKELNSVVYMGTAYYSPQKSRRFTSYSKTSFVKMSQIANHENELPFKFSAIPNDFLHDSFNKYGLTIVITRENVNHESFMMKA